MILVSLGVRRSNLCGLCPIYQDETDTVSASVRSDVTDSSSSANTSPIKSNSLREEKQTIEKISSSVAIDVDKTAKQLFSLMKDSVGKPGSDENANSHPPSEQTKAIDVFLPRQVSSAPMLGGCMPSDVSLIPEITVSSVLSIPPCTNSPLLEQSAQLPVGLNIPFLSAGENAIAGQSCAVMSQVPTLPLPPKFAELFASSVPEPQMAERALPNPDISSHPVVDLDMAESEALSPEPEQNIEVTSEEDEESVDYGADFEEESVEAENIKKSGAPSDDGPSIVETPTEPNITEDQERIELPLHHDELCDAQSELSNISSTEDNTKQPDPCDERNDDAPSQ